MSGATAPGSDGAISAARPGGPFGRLSRLPIRWAMRLMLLSQLALAGLLLWTDLEEQGVMTPDRVDPVATPAPTPGDQRRPYSPATIPQRPDAGGAAGPGDLALPDLGERLAFERREHAEHGALLLVSGRIAAGDEERFLTALDEAGEVGTIALHSPGGQVVAALAMGRAIRERGLDTLVTAGASCNSACPNLLFAGVERSVSRRAWIGLHQAAFEGRAILTTARAVESVQALQGEILAHVDAMGVDPAVMRHALSTPYDQAYFLVDEELERYRVATRLID